MSNSDPGHHGFFGGKLRKLRRSKRVALFPAGTSDLTPRGKGPVPGGGTKRVRHRRRTRVLSELELFAAVCVIWTMIVALVVVIELGSESEWFFVEYETVHMIDQGTWVIGNKAYMPDGRVMQIEKKSTGLSEGRDITGMLGKGPQARSLKWTRIGAVLGLLPALVLLVRVGYRRVVRARLRT
jgi:hypothetical protein